MNPNINFEEILKSKIDIEHIKTILPSTLYYNKLIETYIEVYNMALDIAAEKVLLEVIDINDNKTNDYFFQGFSDGNKVRVDKESILKLKI